MKKQVVLSLSGGMDSTGLMLYLLANDYEINTLSFNYGQRHNIELLKLQKNIQYLKDNGYNITNNIVDLSVLGKLYNSALTGQMEVPEGNYDQENMKLTVVPNRNTIFASIIFGYALSISTKHNNCNVDIALGVHAGDHTIYPDTRPEFFNELLKVFKLGNWDADNINYILPYLNYNKTYILQDIQNNCNKLSLNFNTILFNTNTCYNPTSDGKSCGKCGSCSERIEAFNNLKLVDPVLYV